MSTFRWAVGLAGAMSCTLLAAAPSPAGTASEASDYAADIRVATNAERADRDRRHLGEHVCLRRFAMAQARRIARDNRLSHTRDLAAVQRACDMGYVGENVAYTSGSGQEVVELWMGSPEHRANILKPQYRLLGVGAVHRRGVWWSVQVFGLRA